MLTKFGSGFQLLKNAVKNDIISLNHYPDGSIIESNELGDHIDTSDVYSIRCQVMISSAWSKCSWAIIRCRCTYASLPRRKGNISDHVPRGVVCRCPGNSPCPYEQALPW